MSDAQSTLMLVIAREAEKLNKLSLAANDPIAHMEALEVLCRCTKQLRAPIREPEEDEEEVQSIPDALKAVAG